MSRFLMTWLCGIAVLALAVPVHAQPGGGFGGRGFGGPGGPGGPGGMGGPGGGMGMLLRNAAVQDELELADNQKEELTTLADELRDEIGGQMREMFQGMRDLTDEERQEKMGEMRSKMTELSATVEGRIKEVLLPHQFDRLKQISVQTQLRAGAGGITQGPLAEELGITDEQRQELEAKAQEVNAELQKKIEKLRAEARAELMQVLTSEQRVKLEAMTGAEFDMTQLDQGFGGPGSRGSRGARGGGRGGN